MHRCEWKDGKLHHYFNDELLAVVDEAHLNDYIIGAGLDGDLIPLPE